MLLYVANATGWSRDSLLDLPPSELSDYAKEVLELKLIRQHFN
jgi:hypothetical protein